MKKNELTKAVLTALLLASSSVMAASDYPAADFQPKVIYSDSGAQAAGGSSSAATAAKSVAADSKFPAANFEPKVLFSDTEYKHTQAAPSAGKFSSSAPASATTEAAEPSETQTPASSNNNLIGLLALAVVGFFLYNKKATVNKPAASTASHVAANVDTGVTGVEKYLEKQGITKTGVAKYLDKQGANPATGVAKYMAKQIVKDREAAAAKATGVEKYLRDKV